MSKSLKTGIVSESAAVSAVRAQACVPRNADPEQPKGSLPDVRLGKNRTAQLAGPNETCASTRELASAPARPALRDSELVVSSALPHAGEAHGSNPNPYDRLFQRMARILLPRHDSPHQLLRLRRYFIAAGTSVLAVGVMFASYAWGALPGEAFVEIAVTILLAILGFFVVFRTGLNLKAKDPSLTMPQMLAATVIVLYAIYSTNAERGVFLILLLMAFLFGVLRLRTKSLLLFALFILAGYGWVISMLWQFKPQAMELAAELLQWTALAVTLPWFALMGGYVSELRERLRRSNAEQLEALQKIKSDESTLAQAQRIAQLGSWVFDPQTRAATWSRETYRIFGVDPVRAAPVADEFLQLVHPKDRTHYRERIRPAVYEGRSFDTQFRIVLPTDEVRWVHVMGEPVIGDRGQTTLLRGTVMDVTERHAQENALKQARDEAAGAQATLVDAIESLTEAFGLFDADDRLILCNSRYAETLVDSGRFEDLAGMRFEDLVRASLSNGEVISPQHANDIEAWVAERVRDHRNPGPVPRELELGNGRWLQLTEGVTRAGGIVAVRSDITERKQLEQRQVMEHAVTRLLAESENVAEAIPNVIRTICESLGWDAGARWQCDERDRTLRCAETWCIDSKEVRQFLAASSERRFAPAAEGLIRRAWTTGQPVWIADVSTEPGFLRANIASNAGLRGAFAFPIESGGERNGVMEFYTRYIRQADPALLRVLDSIGLQIGQFIARNAAQEKLRQLAHFDFLTGLPNRNLFNELLAHALAKAERRKLPLAVLFIDLDSFKEVNDCFGHDAGDHLLVTFAQRLGKCLRRSDTIARNGGADTAARLGGDEFVVLIDEFEDSSQLRVVVQRILTAAAQPFDLAGPQGRVSASIGISVYPDDGTDIETLTKCADSAMYRAKQAGKNTYRYYSDGGTTEAPPRDFVTPGPPRRTAGARRVGS